MGPTALRQLLKNLCNNSPWKYAVFWKLKHRNRMFLIWEDGYCDYSKPREPAESMLDSVSFSETNGIISFGSEASAYNGSSVENPIGLAVANMSCLLYSLGEGVVGQVASTAKDCWVFADSVYAGVNSKLVPEYPDEWLLQFAAGIKTILLVPVVPHGVVQLGSLETVNEDPALVSHIKNLFNTLQYVAGASMPLTSSSDLLAQLPSSLTSPLLENLSESLDVTGNLLNPFQKEPLVKKNLIALDGVPLSKNKLPSPQVMPLFMILEKPQGPGKDLQPNFGSTRDADFSALSVDPTEVSFPHNQSMVSNHLEMEENMFNFPCLEEDQQAFSECNNSNIGAKQADMDMNFYLSGDIVDQPFIGGTIDEMDHKSVGGVLSFPMDSELHKVLGSTLHREGNQYLWDPTVLGEDVCGNLDFICHRDLTEGTDLLVKDSNEFGKGGDDGHLLDAMVANTYGDSDNTTSNRSKSVWSPNTSAGQFAVSCQTQSQSEGGILVGGDSVPWSNMSSEIGKIVSKSGASSFKSMMNTLIDEEQQIKGFRYMQSRGGVKFSRVSKRKASAGETYRPRPRDRQMIQDRIKELRELVPNGAKGTIDALLDRTIKHMLFLRSVPEKAEKLRRGVHPKVVGRKNWKWSGTQPRQNGISWAFEMGSQLGEPPIVVEDLDHPGHMLIEMLCGEHGVFLEIAQLIQQLKLTILKGVMETRTDKIWAHFIVETSRGFERMEAFWPLMQLWQRINKSIPIKF